MLSFYRDAGPGPVGQHDLDGDDITQILRLTALDLAPTGFDVENGAGLIRLDAALRRVLPPANRLEHGVIPAGSLQVIDVEPGFGNPRLFVGFPEPIGTGQYQAIRYTLEATTLLLTNFDNVEYVWPRNSGTHGAVNKIQVPFSYFNDEPGFAEVVSFTEDSVTLRTYVYDVRDFWNPSIHVAWWPTTPANASIAFTALGLGLTGGVGVSGLPEPTVVTAVQVLPKIAQGRTTFEVTTELRGEAKLSIYSIEGRLVRQYAWRLASDLETITWDGRDEMGAHAASRIYFYDVSVDNESVLADKFVFLR